MKGKYQTKSPLMWLFWVSLAVLLISTTAVIVISLQLARERNVYQDMSAALDAATTPTAQTASPTLPAEQPLSTEHTLPALTTVPTGPDPDTLLAQYEALHAENPDFFGWVKVEGTKLDYPVMHAPKVLEKYLHADFYGNYAYGGTPYMDVRCSPDSENYLIYGHNMTDGSMFRSLLRYKDKNYWQKHPIIRFDTPQALGEYRVVAAFYDRVYDSHEEAFRFYDVIELEDPESYDDAIRSFKKKARYDTGITPEYGTQLITLVTCAYHVRNGRFVVVAARLPSE